MRTRTEIKHTLGILLTALLLLGSTGSSWAAAQSPPGSHLRVLHSDEQAILLELTVHGFEVETVEQEGRTYHRMIIPDMAQPDTPGAPQVPTRGALLGLPTTERVSLEILEAEHETLNGYHPSPAPGRRPIEGGENSPAAGAVESFFTLDQDVYATNAFHPSQVAKIDATGYLRDQAVAQVRFYPVQVNPVTGQVHLYRRVLARITWNTPLSLAATKEQEISPAFEHVLKETSSIYGQTLRWNLGNTPAGRYTATIMAQVRSTGLAHDQILLDQAHLTDANGGDQVLQLETTVHDSPIVGLSTFNDSPTELGDRTTLSASMTSGTNAVYTWDFGDGSPLQAGTPIKHTYPATGTYTARVTATNSVSSQAQVTTVTITDVPPAASFISSSPDILGQTTIFQSTSTGTNLTHHWDFGDGSPPVSSRTPIITHTYTYTDTYTAVLILTNSAGSSTAVGTVDIVSHPDPPIASFTSSSPDEIGQTTVFINTSQDGGDEEENVSYAWIFGDGTISAARHPTHTYAAVGTYLVSLTITNRFASDTFSDTVLIGDVPISGLSIEEDSPTILDAVTTLSGTTTSGTNISYLWTLGDGTLGTGQNLTHAYGAVGNYGVVLTTTNSLGSLAVTGTVTIVDEPIDGLSISYSGPTYLGSSATFTAVTTAGTNLVYNWEFGDGQTATGAHLTHVYAVPGTYDVTVTAINRENESVASTSVTILHPDLLLFLPLMLRNSSP